MISVVAASYNEAENVPRLAERLRAALGGLEHELILVDDSSPDGTADVASRYFEGYSDGSCWADRLPA